MLKDLRLDFCEDVPVVPASRVMMGSWGTIVVLIAFAVISMPPATTRGHRAAPLLEEARELAHQVHTGSNGIANIGWICVEMEDARKHARDVSLPVLDGERPDRCTPGERPV